MLASPGAGGAPLAKSLAITGARCVCHLGLRARSARTLSCLQETRRGPSLTLHTFFTPATPDTPHFVPWSSLLVPRMHC